MLAPTQNNVVPAQTLDRNRSAAVQATRLHRRDFVRVAAPRSPERTRYRRPCAGAGGAQLATGSVRRVNRLPGPARSYGGVFELPRSTPVFAEDNVQDPDLSLV
jgi:hypothetical protein